MSDQAAPPDSDVLPAPQPHAADIPRGSAIEVLQAFFKLGVTCFGGPVAHIGYFRDEFVNRRQWLPDGAFADLVALCQFLPGPASSKLGFSLGLLRAGYWGGLAAWAGFTLPSALLLVAFAFGASALSSSALGQGLLHGLKLVAVTIVAQAVWGMARTLCPDRTRAAIGVAAVAFALLAPPQFGQITAILFGAAAGLAFCRGGTHTLHETPHFNVSHTVGILAGLAFLIVLAVSFAPLGDTPLGMFSAFFRSGALVFGGGHVVLPLLSEAVVSPGWTDNETFLAGYGAAQAVPGPLFTFAAFLGASPGAPVNGWTGAALALLAIFLPGTLLQLAALPFWNTLRKRGPTQAALRGVNAAVVGILGAALYSPVWTSSVQSPLDLVIAVAGFVLLVVWKCPPLGVVALTAVAATTNAWLLS